MRVSLVVVLPFLFVGCASGYRPIPATPPERLKANVEGAVARQQAEAKAEHERAAKARAAHLAARAEARTSYVAMHPERPANVLEALRDGSRIVLGMTAEEAFLVIEQHDELPTRTVSEGAVVEAWGVAHAPVVSVTFRDGYLAGWTSVTPATPEIAVAVRGDAGEQLLRPQ